MACIHKHVAAGCESKELRRALAVDQPDQSRVYARGTHVRPDRTKSLDIVMHLLHFLLLEAELD